MKPCPHLNLFIIAFCAYQRAYYELTLIPLTLTLLLGNRGWRREGGSSLIKTEWQQELGGDDGKWKVENEEGYYERSLWGSRDVCNSLLALSVQKGEFAADIYQILPSRIAKLYRDTVLKFLNYIMKLLCEISK